MKKTRDPFWWTFFSAGGTLSALCLPVLLLLFGLVIPLGWVEAPGYEALRARIAFLPARLFLFVLITFSLLHWAHRFRFTLYDGLQLKHLETLILAFCYGGALAGSLLAGLLLWQL